MGSNVTLDIWPNFWSHIIIDYVEVSMYLILMLDISHMDEEFHM